MKVKLITSEDIELTETGITASEKGQRDEGIVITGPGFVKDLKTTLIIFFLLELKLKKMSKHQNKKIGE